EEDGSSHGASFLRATWPTSPRAITVILPRTGPAGNGDFHTSPRNPRQIGPPPAAPESRLEAVFAKTASRRDSDGAPNGSVFRRGRPINFTAAPGVYNHLAGASVPCRKRGASMSFKWDRVHV